MVAPNIVTDDDIINLIINDDLPGEQPTFKAYIEANVYDKEGHLIQHHKQPMRSLTQYFLAFISVALIGTYPSSSSNTAQSILTNVLGMPSMQSTTGSAAIGFSWSIQVGSGTQAFSPTLNGLAAPISNGTGAGQLSYNSMIINPSGATISVSLTVSNTTSSTIKVTEIGLIGSIILVYENSSSSFASNSYTSLLSYDTFSAPIVMLPNSTATFQIVLMFSG